MGFVSESNLSKFPLIKHDISNRNYNLLEEKYWEMRGRGFEPRNSYETGS